jgi:hypothetical protein
MDIPDERTLVGEAFAFAIAELGNWGHDLKDEKLLRGIAAGIVEIATAGETDSKRVGKYAALRAQVYAACNQEDQFTPEMEAVLHANSST